MPTFTISTCDDDDTNDDVDDDQRHIFNSISTNENPFEIELYSFEKVHIIFGTLYSLTHHSAENVSYIEYILLFIIVVVNQTYF